MNTLTGQVALVTGSSRGIGQACAQHLARQGATVIVHARERQTEAQAVLEQIGGRGAVMLADLTDPDAVKRLYEAIESRFGRLDILVNNAGITLNQLLARTSEAAWQEVIETNLGSVYRSARLASKLMLKRHHGRIINLASVVGQRGNPGQTAYAAAKAGVIGFTRALALELAPRAITVNAVSPGLIASDMTNVLQAGQIANLVAQIPLGRLGQTDDVARAVAFLAAPEAGYITGQTLNVDGGMVMH